MCRNGSPRKRTCATPRGPLRRLLTTALALSSCGFGPLSALGAGLALVGRRQVKALPNSSHSLRWANVALGVGVLNSMLWVAAWAWLQRQPEPPSASTATEFIPLGTQHAAASPVFPDFPDIETLPVPAAHPSDGRLTETTRSGPVWITQVGSNVDSLAETLTEQARWAQARNLQPIVLLLASDCAECTGVERALEGAKLQQALAGTLVIRVDSDRFESELAHLRMPVQSAPGFVRLTPSGLPLDCMDADEWDGDQRALPDTLVDFLSGKLERRHPWRGGLRIDETPI